MLVENDPERTVLKSVDPKNNPAARRNQRVGWTFSHLVMANTILDGFNFSVTTLIEIEGTGPCNALLLIAHSMDQRAAIIPAKARSKATFGTST